MKKLIVIICTMLSVSSYAQTDPVYTNYMSNGLAINPAYAGSRNSFSAVALHRSRWTAMDGAPTTQSFSVHSPTGKSNFAFGLNAVTDKLGPNSSVFAGITGAYHVRFRIGKLSMGLRTGLYNSVLNANEFNIKDSGDPLIGSDRQSVMAASVDFGLYYYTRKFYAGLSINHLGNSSLKYQQFSEANFSIRQVTTLGMGYAFEVSDKLVLKPSVLIKATKQFDANIDIAMAALIYQKVWLGVSLRQLSSMNFMLNLNVTDFMRIGYSFDTFHNQLNTVSKGTHELFLGFDFSFNKTKMISPRYL